MSLYQIRVPLGRNTAAKQARCFARGTRGLDGLEEEWPDCSEDLEWLSACRVILYEQRCSFWSVPLFALQIYVWIEVTYLTLIALKGHAEAPHPRDKPLNSRPRRFRFAGAFEAVPRLI